ncbi:MAG TPA: GlxA family transcriptional regulator [Polyangiaceae bacterium]
MSNAATRVWVVVVPGTGLINIAGPTDVFGIANQVLRREAYRVELVGPTAPTSRTRYGVSLSGIRPMPKTCARLPDIVIIAGSPMKASPEVDEQLVPWLQRHHHKIPMLVSTCTGAFTLAKAGVLDGRRATTHWLHLDELRARFPAVRVVDEGIFVQDGTVWTSAGVTAGIDLMLALVEHEHGHAVAMEVAKMLVLFLRRSGNQAQFSSALARQQREPSRLHEVAAFVLEHLEEPLSVQCLAKGLGMSVRTLSRFCRERFDESPAELVRRLRVDEARRLLEETSLPLKEITARTGLGDVSTLWRVFTQRLGVTPAAYRERFAMVA